MNFCHNIIPDLSSIIMCCYNGEKYIQRSFESILAQTYPNIELIFVNDGSSDASLDIAHSFHSQFKARNISLKIISQENSGVGVASRKGLEECSGEFISYLDVDDFLMPDFVEQMVSTLKNSPNASITRCNAYTCKENDLSDTEILIKTQSGKGTNNLFKDILLYRINNYAGTYLARASIIRDFYNTHDICTSKYGQNLQIVLPCAYNGESYFIDKPLMTYVIRDNSISHPTSLNKRIEMAEGYKKIRVDICNTINPSLTQLKHLLNIEHTKICLVTILNHPDSSEEKPSLFSKYYTQLKQLGGNSWEFRTYNAIIHNKRFIFLYRLMFLFSRIIKRF